MKVALSFIGTGKYLNYLPNWYQKVQENFLPEIEKHIFIFTDGEVDDAPEKTSIHFLEHKEWPFITLDRFDTLLSVKNELSAYDWFIFMDADTLVIDKITPKDIFDENKSLIGVHHPCHYLQMPPHHQFPGSFEVNQLSTACIDNTDDTSVYYQGCLWGGKVPEVLKMIEELDRNIKTDYNKNIISVWHDESHLNKYFCSHKELVNTLSSSYAYPEVFASSCNFEPIIVHLSKDNSQYQV